MHEPLAIGTFAILAVTAFTSFQGFKNPAFRERFIFDPAAILRDREYYRLLTSAFLHADWLHFGFNAFTLYSFGRLIEIIFGLGTLLLIYFGAIVGGGLLSLWLHRHHEYRALGASGGACGVVFASIFLLPGSQVIMFPLPIPLPSWLYAILFLGGSFLALRRQADNIGHDAHLGGAVIGLLIATALHPSIVRENLGLYVAVLGLSAALFAWLWFNPLFLPARDPWARGRDWIAQARRRRKKRPESSEADNQELDRLLGKISTAGLDSLSATERKRLETISRAKRGQR